LGKKIKVGDGSWLMMLKNLTDKFLLFEN
jgi:hypothetical protein